jgi:uncharacterized protein YciI
MSSRAPEWRAGRAKEGPVSHDQFPPGVSVEPVWLVEVLFTPEAAERRPAVRAEHLTRIAELKRAGTLIAGGAYSDALTSSILLLRAADAVAAEAIAGVDVYVRAGVWSTIRARPFGRVVVSGPEPT